MELEAVAQLSGAGGELAVSAVGVEFLDGPGAAQERGGVFGVDDL